MLKPMNQHLDKYALIEGEQKGAKVGCSGTIDNLLIDRMVCEDSKRNKRNLSMAWIDVKKAYDSVYHKWLVEMMASPSVPRLGGQNGEQALCHLEHTHSCNNKAREGNVRFDQVQQGPAGHREMHCVQGFLRYALILWLGNSKPQRATN